MEVEHKGKHAHVVWGINFSRNSPAPRRILWGLFLMALGAALLLGQMGVLQVPSLWKLWPTVLGVMAVGSLMEHKPGGAASLGLMCAAFFAAQFGWFGLTYRTFWPILVVAVGLGIAIGALSGEDRCEPEVENGAR